MDQVGHHFLHSTGGTFFDVGVHEQQDFKSSRMMASHWVHSSEDERKQTRYSFCEVSPTTRAIAHALHFICKMTNEMHTLLVVLCDFWGQLTLVSMSSPSEFGVGGEGVVVMCLTL